MGKARQIEQALQAALTTGVQAGQTAAFQSVLLNTASHILNVHYNDVQSLVAAESPENVLRAVGAAAREVWPLQWRQALTGPLSSVMQAATAQTAPVFGAFTLANPQMASYLAGYVSKLSESLSATSYDKFAGVLSESMDRGLSVPDTQALLQQRIPELNDTRARLIARTETHAASNGASHEQARSSGIVTGKTWLHSGNLKNARPEHVAQNRVTVGIDETFPDGSDYPSDPNCRCTLLYVVDKSKIGLAA